LDCAGPPHPPRPGGSLLGVLYLILEVLGCIFHLVGCLFGAFLHLACGIVDFFSGSLGGGLLLAGDHARTQQPTQQHHQRNVLSTHFVSS
jgi:hypothetical protein